VVAAEHVPSAPILTPRLELRLLSSTLLEAALARDFETCTRLLGTPAPRQWLARPGLIGLRLRELQLHPEYEPWSLRGICLRSDGEMIGHIGFHSAPDPDYLRPNVSGAVEFGYHIYRGYRHRGYATEAVQGLIDWAIRTQGVTRLVVSIAPTNRASKAIARRFGFRPLGGQDAPAGAVEEELLLLDAGAHKAPTPDSGAWQRR
jgi:RimJ/RimL family protein N-acetyltransferase